MRKGWVGVGVLFAAMTALSGCSSTPPVKTQAYAQLSNHRVFENDFQVVWKGIESALRNNRVAKRDPEEVSHLEWSKLTKRTLETDWIYTQSRDKYVEYRVNGSPRKIYLQTRLKYLVEAHRVLGGTEVTVKTQEEVEKLKDDGTSAGYEEMDQPDPSRANELLDKVNQAILSAPPI